MSWSEVIGKFIDLLKTVPGVGIAVLVILSLFLGWVLPMGGMMYLNYYGTTRVVDAIHELKAEIQVSRLTANGNRR